MPLAEIIVLEIGSSIAKSLLKVWLRSDIATSISSDLLDILKSRFKDTLDQRRALRQFETIGEKVAESLLPIFEIEGANLDEGNRTSVALAVANSLNKSNISSQVLAEKNLDHTELAKYVKLINLTATQHMGLTEVALYERIIDESCEYIIDIASQLPAYNERTVSEILKRESQLLDKAGQVLREVQRMREELNPLAMATHFELEYRRSIVRSLDVLQLFGADLPSIIRRHHLSVAYVALTVEKGLSGTSGSNIHIDHVINANVLRGSNVLSINEALAGSNRLLIRGPAGSGKTTLLQWIAVRSASRTFEEELSHWNDTLPFFIRLRQCTQSGLPTPEIFPRLIAPIIADIMPKGWVHQQLESGRAIVLVDGIDEVPALKREEVRLWFKELVDTFPLSRFIITSRPHAIEEGWLGSESFSDTELQPMTLSDIHVFIDHWHEAVKEELPEDEKPEFEALRRHLKEEVKYNRSKRILATNPLLCAMLCALNRDRRQQIPSDRIELYQACCSMLLERRDKERQLELADYPSLNYRQKRVLLEDLAYWLIKNGQSELAQKDADDRFSKKLANMQELPKKISGENIRLLFVERTGMLREPIEGRIDFTHRTFQEFLAAYAAVDEADIGLLVKNAHDDQWREVIIVAAGLAAKPAREELIQKLILRGDNEPSYRHQIHLLAVSCLESTVELGQLIRNELQMRLKNLVPPKNRAEAKALAVAGELVVPFLAKRQRYPALITASCIRTLALIGSETALDALEIYADDGRSTVTDELFRALDSFDKDTYVHRILSRTVQGKYSLPMNFTALHVFQYFPDLTSLDLNHCEQISDLKPISSLKRLISLNLTGCRSISDLSPLSNLTQLTTLNLSSCKRITDLSPLSNLTQLTSLNLFSCERITDLSPLTGLTQLKTLTLAYCENVTDHSPLLNFTQLTTLYLSWCKRIKDLNFLNNSFLLEKLDLNSCFSLSDLVPLANITHLSSLVLAYCALVTDLRPLANLTHLTSLDLSFCPGISDLSPLGKLKNLKSLDLSFCQSVEDLSPLVGLNELNRLNLRGISHQIIVPQSIKEQLKANKHNL